MSVREPHDYQMLFEKDPGLLGDVERFGHEDGGKRPDWSPTETSSEAKEAVQDDWPELEPLGGELPPVQALDLELLSLALRPLVEDVSERMQALSEYAAASAIISLAGCVGRRALIQPKVHDTGWRIVPNLWGANIAPPGFMKSPILRTITHPLIHVEDRWRAEFESARDDFESEKEQADLRHQAWKEDFKRAVKKNMSPPIQPDKSLRAPQRRSRSD